MLSKSNFMSFVACPAQLWLRLHRPDLLPPPDAGLEEVFALGREVDDLARALFPGGVEAGGFGETGWRRFQALARGDGQVFYQPTVVAPAAGTGDLLTCRADIVVRRGEAWDVHEVKSGTHVKEDHCYDLAFQREAFEAAGLAVSRTYLVHVNRDYVRGGEVDARRLLMSEDVTREVDAVRTEVRRLIPKALAAAAARAVTPALIRECVEADGDCEFAPALLAALDGAERAATLGALPDSTLRALLAGGLVTEDALAAERLESLRAGGYAHPVPPRVNVGLFRRELAAELAALAYPLYYLDYETYSPAVPRYDGYRPYERVPFQLSLDVQREPGGPLEHHDFLAESADDPSGDLVAALRGKIGPTGHLVAWNAVFEKGVHKELAARHPGDAAFLLDLNERMYDLMLVFRKGRLYVDSRLAGRASLKLVAPLLVGDLYAGLDIRNGAVASASWPRLVGWRPLGEAWPDRAALRSAMLRYCAVDTLAMVRILDYLRDAAAGRVPLKK
jgi:hypothetical protein